MSNLVTHGGSGYGILYLANRNSWSGSGVTLCFVKIPTTKIPRA